jgi:hypothetical protein
MTGHLPSQTAGNDAGTTRRRVAGADGISSQALRPLVDPEAAHPHRGAGWPDDAIGCQG